MGTNIKMADSGIAQHPKYFGKKVNSEMRLPGDTRLFRDIKIKEIPSWLMRRDMSPLGLWSGLKRFKYGLQSKYLPDVTLVEFSSLCVLLVTVWLPMSLFTLNFVMKKPQENTIKETSNIFQILFLFP